ncbi:hypothetical protein LTS08_005118 [Lithohypha guttulata]|nr:hypothetical protein LTS08_005118 [Lithohypha guttulata]
MSAPNSDSKESATSQNIHEHDEDQFWKAASVDTEYWKVYLDARPKYHTGKFYDLIFDYYRSHRSGSPSLPSVAHDIGTGPGQVAGVLSNQFGEVIASDLNKTHLSAAEHFLKLDGKKNITLQHAGAEDVSKHFAPYSADFIAAAECMPLLNIPAALTGWATLLKPNGTLAMWFYGRPTFADASDFDVAACNEIYGKIANRAFRPFYDVQGPRLVNVRKATDTMVSWLDNIELDSSIWTDVHRWKWNSHLRMEFSDAEDLGWPRNHIDKTQPGEKVENMSDTSLWSETWNIEDWKSFLKVNLPAFSGEWDDTTQGMWQELADKMGGPSEKRKVIWPVDYWFMTFTLYPTGQYIDRTIMGGHAFALDGLSTPRISTAVYARILPLIEHRLAAHFDIVTHAIEAPAKQDHGDIDLLTVPLLNSRPSTIEIARLLHAERYYSADRSNGVLHFAIPWPDNPSDIDNLFTSTEKSDWKGMESVRATRELQPAQPSNITTIESPNARKYFQVDLTICNSRDELHWRLFALGHGDAVNILSSMIRHKGLTLTTKALYLRIPDIDTSNPKIKRIELSRNLDQVLKFLGIDTSKFWKEFGNLDDLMAYLSTCRFYNPQRLKEATEEKRQELIVASLNPRDKTHLDVRPVFRFWYEKFLPVHENDTPSVDALMSRDEARVETFKFFGGDTKERYESTKKRVGTLVAQDKLWVNLRQDILAQEGMTEADIDVTIRAIRREIVPAASTTLTSQQLSGLQRAYLECDWATVYDWAITYHTAAVARWHAEIEEKRKKPMMIDVKKSNKFSQSELEIYSAEDDMLIVSMKAAEATWIDILAALGKTSKSQLQAHWKKSLLQQKVES